MEVIQPTPVEKRPTLEEKRKELLENWGGTIYYQRLDREVKKNHSDIFRLVVDFPTFTLGYQILSELYKLEETIMVTKYLVDGLYDSFEFEYRSVEDHKIEK